jgi:drug/metabolite transporter (DMT)-like permease
VAVTLGVVFLGETLRWQLVAGGLLVLAGIAVVNLRGSLSARPASESALPAAK